MAGRNLFTRCGGAVDSSSIAWWEGLSFRRWDCCCSWWRHVGLPAAQRRRSRKGEDPGKCQEGASGTDGFSFGWARGSGVAAWTCRRALLWTARVSGSWF